MVSSPKDCLVKAIHALYQSSLTRANGAPRNCERLMARAPDRKYVDNATALDAIEYCPFWRGTRSGRFARDSSENPAAGSSAGCAVAMLSERSTECECYRASLIFVVSYLAVDPRGKLL